MRIIAALAFGLCWLFWPTDYASGQTKTTSFGFSPSAPRRAPEFFGNPKWTADKEAQSMSPPEWGEEFEPLPEQAPDQFPREAKDTSPTKRSTQFPFARQPGDPIIQSHVESQRTAEVENESDVDPTDEGSHFNQNSESMIEPDQRSKNSSARGSFQQTSAPLSPDHHNGQAINWPSTLGKSTDPTSVLPGAEWKGEFDRSIFDPGQPSVANEFSASDWALNSADERQAEIAASLPHQPTAQDQTGPAYPPPDAFRPIQVAPGSGNRVPFDKGYRSDGYGGVDLNYLDEGQSFSYEAKKREFPPMSEILRTGRYFGSAEWQTLQPHFHGSTAITSASAANASSHDFGWGYESSSLYRAGFESKYGPGVEFDYWQFDHESRPVEVTSDGVFVASVALPDSGASGFGNLSTGALGDTLRAKHALEVHSLGMSFFKEMKLPISRVNGLFGPRYVSVAHLAEAELFDASQTLIGSVQHITDFRGFGPRIRIEYVRPIGHTKLEAIATFGSSLLFGNRDQFVLNSTSGDYYRTNANEFIAILEGAGGIQYVRYYAENRSVFARLAYQSQSWIGGGTADSLDESFGFRGFGITLGLNR